MQYKAILKILSVLLMMFSVSMLPPAVVAMIYQDSTPSPYLASFVLTFMTGFLFWLFLWKHDEDLKGRDGFLVVVLFWVVMCFFATIPLMLAELPHDNFTDAMFESVSGFTTTGATAVVGIDSLPHAMRYYRQQLQFLGGMGIIVLAVAVLPMLGIGGMQLYRAETPGPIKDSKLTPRITETAKTLWFIYVGLTALCGLCYYFAGMDGFDAIGESFATVSTGGFSMHDNSFAYYHNHVIYLIAMFFMILGATNFGLHFIALRRFSLMPYVKDEEFKVYLKILIGVSAICAIVLIRAKVFSSDLDATINSFFNVVSLSTTTGFVAAPFEKWPSFLPILIMIVATIGGCAASTSGGIKVMRALLLNKQSTRELHRLIHPHLVENIKFGQRSLPEKVLQAMWAFIASYILLFVVILLLLMNEGLDFITGFGAVAASLSNAGVSIGHLADNFSGITVFSKWLLMFAMLAGRLEIFTLLVLLTPAFWRK